MRFNLHNSESNVEIPYLYVDIPELKLHFELVRDPSTNAIHQILPVIGIHKSDQNDGSWVQVIEGRPVQHLKSSEILEINISESKLEFEIAKMSFKEGDVLVIKSDENHSVEELKLVKKHIQDTTGFKVGVISITDNIELSILRKEDVPESDPFLP